MNREVSISYDSSLVEVDEVDFGNTYQFAIFKILKDADTGDLFWAFDTGCSCPIPFEDVTREDIFPLRTSGDYQQFRHAVDCESSPYECGSEGRSGKRDFLDRVWNLMKESK